MKFGILIASLVVSLAPSLSAQNREVGVPYDQYWTGSGGTTTQIYNDLNTALNTSSGSIKRYTGKTYWIRTPYYKYNGYGRDNSGQLWNWMGSSYGAMVIGHTSGAYVNGAADGLMGNKLFISNYPGAGKANWDNRSVYVHEVAHMYGTPDHYLSYPWQTEYTCMMNKNNPDVLFAYWRGFQPPCATIIARNKERGF